MEKIDTDYKRRPWRIEAKRCKMCKPLRSVCGRRTDVVIWYDKLVKKGHISCRLYSMFPVSGSSERLVEYPYPRISSFWTTCFTWQLRPVFTLPGKFENGVFTLKTHHLCSVHATPAKLLRYTIGLKKSRHFFIQSEVKQKSLALVFPRFASGTFNSSSFDWFTGLSVHFVIG